MTRQLPIGSGFGISATAGEVISGVDLSGKTAIVTGGYSGLGRETVRALLLAGARVIVPARDLTRAREALKDLPAVQIEPMDLLDPSSIDAFASRFLASGGFLHILVNNAGIMAAPLMRDARGFESQFATNHLGHFQLSVRLWPALCQTRGARIVAVSSRAHWFAPVDFDDPNFIHRTYEPWLAYGQSKTANILHAAELDRRGSEWGVRAFSVHPGGVVETGLAKYMTRDQIRQAGGLDEQGTPIVDPARGLKNVQQGAATIVWCAASPRLSGWGGVYCEDCDIAPIHDNDTGETSPDGSVRRRGGVKPYAIDAAGARRLWDLSERMLELRPL